MTRARAFSRWWPLLFLCPGCFGLFPQHPVENIEGNWASPLDGDLRVAIAQTDREFADEGSEARVRWAGTRASAYGVERGVDGAPVRQSVEVLYAITYPSKNKCYLSIETTDSYQWAVRLAREHLGGGRYGAPRIIGMGAVRSDGTPVGREILCSAVDSAKGGVHVPAAAEGAQNAAAVVEDKR